MRRDFNKDLIGQSNPMILFCFLFSHGARGGSNSGMHFYQNRISGVRARGFTFMRAWYLPASGTHVPWAIGYLHQTAIVWAALVYRVSGVHARGIHIPQFIPAHALRPPPSSAASFWAAYPAGLQLVCAILVLLRLSPCFVRGTVHLHVKHACSVQ